jgi:hypothetical protein
VGTAPISFFSNPTLTRPFEPTNSSQSEAFISGRLFPLKRGVGGIVLGVTRFAEPAVLGFSHPPHNWPSIGLGFDGLSEDQLPVELLEDGNPDHQVDSARLRLEEWW